MLSEDGLESVRDIGRRLRWDRTKLPQLVDGTESQLATSRRRRAHAKMLVAAVAFAGLTLLGPRLLSETEVKIRKTPPPPRTSPPAPNVAPLPDPAATATSSVSVVDLLVGR